MVIIYSSFHLIQMRIGLENNAKNEKKSDVMRYRG